MNDEATRLLDDGIDMNLNQAIPTVPDAAQRE